MLPFLLALSVAAPASEPEARPELLSARLRAWGVKAAFPAEYEVSPRDADPDEAPGVEAADAKAPGGRFLRLERLADAARGEAHIKDRLVQLQSLYDPRPEPYYAILTKKTVCQDKYQIVYRPRKNKGPVLHYLELYANERMIYGACTGDMAFYRAAVAMIYCPRSRSAVILESFIPAAGFTQADFRALESLRCL